MSISELKEIIHHKIEQIDDEQLLSAIKTILSKDDKIFIIPEKVKEEIKLANEDIKKGNFYTLEDFQKKYNQWLND